MELAVLFKFFFNFIGKEFSAVAALSEHCSEFIVQRLEE
jgi:hypothetical protein